MPDYQKMYKTLFIATEKAIEILIDAQQHCEDIYANPQNNDNLINLSEFTNNEM